ncbi:MAG: hypothetical protein LBJ94_01540 [Puniceicoccales bacterium]|jgi:hypothetical protein|nr:hypothetical protein [Puniceicoccales bacterium]
MLERLPLLLFFTLCSGFSYICLLSKGLLEKVRNWLLYGQTAAVILFGGASMVLLHKTLHLSTADFGEYRHSLFIVFALICGLSFFRVRDLLAIRGFAILLLFLCDKILDSVFCVEIFLSNVFVVEIYCVIIFSMAIGAAPYIFRDFMDRIIAGKKSAQLAGCVGCIFAATALGMLLI